MYKVRISKQKTKFPKVIPFGDLVVVVISIKINVSKGLSANQQALYVYAEYVPLYISNINP